MIESSHPPLLLTKEPPAQAGDALVICAAIPWRFHRNRQQELAERLSAFVSVLYVEPPARDGMSPATAARHFWTVGDQCHVLPSIRGLPGDRMCGLANWLVQKQLAGAVKRTLDTLRRDCTILWIDRIHSFALARAFPEAPVIYDCVDKEWTFGRLSRRRYLKRLEETLLTRADLAIASSRALYRRLSAFARWAELVPNGCDYVHFSRSGNAARPSDLPPPDHPMIGFVGTVSRRSLDFKLLSQVCRLLPGFRFVFIGGADAASARVLSKEQNATLLGPRPYADLPAYLAAFDVAIIPYLVGGQVDYVYPKKLHEYLAAGKLVVATDMPELRPFAEIVRIGRNPEEFVARIEECLRVQADPARATRARKECQAVARENTWERRVEQIISLLGLLREETAYA